jgi:flagellar motor switch protein FliM
VFNTFTSDELELRCGNVPMFKGPVGQKLGNIAVQIDKYIQDNDEDEL